MKSKLVGIIIFSIFVACLNLYLIINIIELSKDSSPIRKLENFLEATQRKEKP